MTMSNQQSKILAILTKTVHLEEVEDVTSKRTTHLQIHQEDGGVIVANNQLPANLPPSHLNHLVPEGDIDKQTQIRRLLLGGFAGLHLPTAVVPVLQVLHDNNLLGGRDSDQALRNREQGSRGAREQGTKFFLINLIPSCADR